MANRRRKLVLKTLISTIELASGGTGAPILEPVPPKGLLLGSAAAAVGAIYGSKRKRMQTLVARAALSHCLDGLVAFVVRHGQDTRGGGLRSRVMGELALGGFICGSSIPVIEEDAGCVG
jgi:hypothetical protein